MKRQSLLILLLILGMVACIYLIYLAEEKFVNRETAVNITFLSGGVSEPERKSLEEIGRKYSLKVIFSSEREEYPSRVAVRISGRNGKTILTTVSNGPWFFINLPSGTYDLEFRWHEDKKDISQLKIDEKRQTVIDVQW